MWQPDPEWTPIPGGRGTLSAGMWRVVADDSVWSVKRISAPSPDHPRTLGDPQHPGYWRREFEVASSPQPSAGLARPVVRRIDEDECGYVIWSEWVRPAPLPGPFVASALGRFAAGTPPKVSWLARDLLRRRLEHAEERGGWPTLARTTVADLCDALWQRREGLLSTYDALPAALCHGDAVPANLIGREHDRVIAIDWSCLGLAPAGTDLGYYALSTREDLSVLLEAFANEHGGDREEIGFAARLMSVYTVVSQAEWALSRVAKGEGALAGKFTHPSVAPYLRALQRQLPHVEALLQHA